MVCEKERESGRRERQDWYGACEKDQRAQRGEYGSTEKKEYSAYRRDAQSQRDDRRVGPVFVRRSAANNEPRCEHLLIFIVADSEEAFLGRVHEDGTSAFEHKKACNKDARSFDQGGYRTPAEMLYRAGLSRTRSGHVEWSPREVHEGADAFPPYPNPVGTFDGLDNPEKAEAPDANPALAIRHREVAVTEKWRMADLGDTFAKSPPLIAQPEGSRDGNEKIENDGRSEGGVYWKEHSLRHLGSRDTVSLPCWKGSR